VDKVASACELMRSKQLSQERIFANRHCGYAADAARNIARSMKLRPVVYLSSVLVDAGTFSSRCNAVSIFWSCPR
jgi:hypothetical protein